MNIYMIRHGETDYNKRGALQGHTDIPLNEAGEQQAREASKAFAQRAFNLVYASPLVRARTTAKIISGWELEKILIDNRLIEMGFGEAEGKIVATLPQSVRNLFERPERFQAPEGGETIEQVKERCQAFLNDLSCTLKTMENDANILIVSHGATIHGLVNCVKKTPTEDFWGVSIGNCTAIEVDYVNGDFILKE